MVLGLIQYHLMRGYLGDAGPAAAAEPRGAPRLVGDRDCLGDDCPRVWPGRHGRLPIDPVLIANWTTWLIVGLAVAYFARAAAGGTDFNRAWPRGGDWHVVYRLCDVLGSFEQAGSSLNLFADRYTLKLNMPTGWFQSVNAIFIIMFAADFRRAVDRVCPHNIAPSLTTKMAWGFCRAGFCRDVFLPGGRSSSARSGPRG
jgi:hypothetical protein